LPPLITLPQFNGNWEAFEAAVYARFEADFLGARPDFDGRKMGLKAHPMTFGKEATYWHFVSSGEVEEERGPDIRRYERIAWVRAVIDNASSPEVRVWKEERRGRLNFHLFCEEAEYLVVLADRGGYVLPWTAYPVEREHERQKLLRRYEQFKA
jgi:hypothetical protein